MKPLWIPLKTKYFLAFERGEKTVEYRACGARWNEAVCWPGRPAVIGHGYSGRRLYGRVVSTTRMRAGEVPQALELYAPDCELIAIKLELGEQPPGVQRSLL